MKKGMICAGKHQLIPLFELQRINDFDLCNQFTLDAKYLDGFCNPTLIVLAQAGVNGQ